MIVSSACDGAGSDGSDKQANGGLAELIYQDALPFQWDKIYVLISDSYVGLRPTIEPYATRNQ